MHKLLSTFVWTIAALAFGCAPAQPPPPAPPPPPPPAPMAAPPPPTPEPAPEPPPPVELTGEQKVKLIQDCWGFYNQKAFDKLSACFQPDATFEAVDSGLPTLTGPAAYMARLKEFVDAFPDASGELQLTLVDGNTAVVVALIRGTHTGTLKTPNGDIPATKKKVGYLFADVLEFKNDKIAKSSWYYDPGILLAQLGVSKAPARKVISEGAKEKPTAITSGSDVEKANLEVFKKYMGAFNAHDLKSGQDTLADDYVFSDLGMPADVVGKKKGIRHHQQILKGFSDAKVEHTNVFAAGDYVVGIGTFSGTNDGTLPFAKIWRPTKKKVSVGSLDIVKFKDGKVVSHQSFSNGMAIAGQLGLLPPPKKAAAKKAAAPKKEAPKPSAPKPAAPPKAAAPKQAAPTAPKQAAPTKQ